MYLAQVVGFILGFVGFYCPDDARPWRRAGNIAAVGWLMKSVSVLAPCGLRRQVSAGARGVGQHMGKRPCMSINSVLGGMQTFRINPLCCAAGSLAVSSNIIQMANLHPVQVFNLLVTC